MSTAMVAIEGVLGDSPYFKVTMLPNHAGLTLYSGLATTHRVVLVTSEPDEGKIDHWLRTQHVRDYATVITPAETVVGYEPIDIRATQLRSLRSSRMDVSLVVDVEPLVIAHAASVGVSGLLFLPSRPAAGRVDLGHRVVRDWSAIEHEVAVQEEMRA